MPVRSFATSGLVACCLLLSAVGEGRAEDKTLFNFAGPSSVKDWAPVKLPELTRDQPAPRARIVQAGKALEITFAGGDWPAVGTTKIAVKGNWKPFQTIKAELTVDRPSVAFFRVCQGKPDAKGKQPHWERTLVLQPGRNEVALIIRHGISTAVIDPKQGDVTSFLIGMFQPAKGQTLRVGNVRVSTDWPAPRVLGWYSPYNHDGYSSAVAREYQRTGAITKFKVLGTDLEVADLPDLAKRLKAKWTKPEAKTIEQVESDFKAELAKLRRDHPKAVLAILRDGWKMVYVNCHGPDGPNHSRENTPRLGESVEVFMRHRSVLMRADLSSIPRGSTILAARLVVTRTTGPGDRKPPEKANLWVAEPCNRALDESSANCYFYAKGKHWKAVSGLYHGEDPDHWPVFLAHGPAGGGAVSTWDFTEAVKFWLDGKHANHGLFLHGDSVDYMRMYTHRAKDVKRRPALMVIYEPNR